MTAPVKRTKNPETAEATSKYYLTNSKLLPAVLKAKAEGRFSNELAGMLLLLTKKYANKPCFSNYTFKEDMISEAMTNLCQNALKFNPEKSNNPFAFYTSCIHNSFLQFLNVEKKHRRIRDQLLIDMGENPSYNFSEELKQSVGGEFSGELSELKSQIDQAHVRVKQEAIDKIEADRKAAEELALASAREAEALAEEIAHAELIEDEETLIDDRHESSLVSF